MNEYNGFTNYPTWNQALWMNASRVQERHWTKRAEEILKECNNDFIEAKYNLASEIREDCFRRKPEIKSDMGQYSEILNWALQEINFEEIAESFLES